MQMSDRTCDCYPRPCVAISLGGGKFLLIIHGGKIVCSPSISALIPAVGVVSLRDDGLTGLYVGTPVYRLEITFTFNNPVI